MASRKEQKEAARQRRLAEERALAERTQRRRRMQMLGGVLVAAVAIVAVAIAISAGGGSSAPVKPHSKQATQLETQVSRFLNGIPQSGTTLGNPKAPVTVIYYGDLECPVCKAFTLGEANGGFPQLVQNDVRQGKVKVVYKSFCTATCNNHPQSVFNQQQVAAYAAGKQNLFWDYADLFYREQQDETTNYVNTSFLDSLAQQTPKLDLTTWQNDQKDPSLLGQVQSDESSANQLGLSGTPTLIASGPKGEKLVNAALPAYSDLEQAIHAVS
jgi:protein-disulfide isomerase